MCLKIRRLLIILENSEKRRSPMITVSINMPNNTNRYLNPTNGNSSELGYGTMQHTNPITQFHPNTCQIHQNSVSQPPSPSAGRNLGEIRESSLSLSLSFRKVETGGVQTIPKSLRAIHVLATPWQPGGKHLNPPAHSRFPQKENASCEHVLSAIVALLFYLCPQVVRERWNG